MYEGSATPGANGEITPVTPPVNYTKEQLDSAAAAARREADTKSKELQTRLDALEAQEEERKNADLSEVDRLKKQNDELTQSSTEKDNLIKGFNDKEETRKAALLKKVEIEMKDLDEGHKALIDQMPLDGKLDLIAQLKQQKAGPGEWGKGPSGDSGTLDEQERKELKDAKTPQERQRIVIRYAGLRKQQK